MTSVAKSFVDSERAALCLLFDELGPDQPTLCEGWSTHDLAAHLWIREADPIGAGGIVIKPLAGVYERRVAELKRKWSFTELVDHIRRGPARWSPFAIPGVDAAVNTIEYFVHHEDVRRAGDTPLPARTLAPEVEDLFWRRMGMLAKPSFRRAQVGVVLERRDGPTPVDSNPVDPRPVDPSPADRSDRRSARAAADGAPATIRATSGARIVTLVGRPSELLLFANGRTALADLEIIGEPDAIDVLHAADLHV